MFLVDYKRLYEDTLRELARRSLYEFFKQSWHVLEPETEFHDSWHIRVVCDHLTAVKNGEIQKLIINIPPGFAKSLMVSCAWNAFYWIDEPATRFLTAAYSGPLSTRDARRTRNIIRSDWYQHYWGESANWEHAYRLTGDQNVKTFFENTKTGWRLAVSVGSSGTGQRGNVLIVDDPVALDQWQSESALNTAQNWFRDLWTTRKADPTTSKDVVVMQRLHPRDPCGWLLENFDDYETLILPMTKPKKSYPTVLGDYDRRAVGELLDPKRYPQSIVNQMSQRLGRFGTAAQLQQDPMDNDAGMITYSFFRFWIKPDTNVADPYFVDIPTTSGTYVTCPVVMLPDKFKQVIQSWDFSFGGQKMVNSQVAGHVYGLTGESEHELCWLLDRVNKHMSFTEMLAAFRKMIKKWPKSRRKLVEAKANGPAVITSLRNEVSGLISVIPKESKVARMHAALPVIESGSVILPHPVIAPWVTEMLDLITQFPYADYDDDADAMSQMINSVVGGVKVSIT